MSTEDYIIEEHNDSEKDRYSNFRYQSFLDPQIEPFSAPSSLQNIVFVNNSIFILSLSDKLKVFTFQGLLYEKHYLRISLNVIIETNCYLSKRGALNLIFRTFRVGLSVCWSSRISHAGFQERLTYSKKIRENRQIGKK